MTHVIPSKPLPARVLARFVAYNLRRLGHDTKGVAAVEFAIVLPLLLSLLLGGFTLFDLFREAERVERSAYTLADLVSRETVVTRPRFDDWRRTQKVLLSEKENEETSSFRVVSALRVWKDGKDETSPGTEEENTEFKIDWAYDSAADSTVPPKDIDLDTLPPARLSNSVLIVTTRSTRRSAFTSSDSEGVQFTEEVIIRPRNINAVQFR